MEIFDNYILFLFSLLLIVFNLLTTKETLVYPLFSALNKTILITIIWLVPFIGLIIAYKQLQLSLPDSSSSNGDGTHIHQGD